MHDVQCITCHIYTLLIHGYLLFSGQNKSKPDPKLVRRTNTLDTTVSVKFKSITTHYLLTKETIYNNVILSCWVGRLVTSGSLYIKTLVEKTARVFLFKIKKGGDISPPIKVILYLYRNPNKVQRWDHHYRNEEFI